MASPANPSTTRSALRALGLFAGGTTAGLLAVTLLRVVL